MENTTEFDLNAATRAWRENLSRSPRLRAENVGELESHLRDSVDALQTKGLRDDEAFLVATRRLGTSTVLDVEFAKVNRREIWLERLFWGLVGMVVIRGIGTMANVLSEVVMGIGLLGSGYRPEIKTAVPVGLLLGALRLTVLAGCVAGFVWLGRRNTARFYKLATLAVRNRVRMGTAVVLISLALLFLGSGLNVVGSVWVAHRLQVPEMGAFAYSRSVSYVLSSMLETFALVTGAVLLFRRHVLRRVGA